METVLTILREVRDPRAFNARHDLSSILYIALSATLCGARTCVDYADFAEANMSDLAEIVDLPHGAPSHDCFSRLFRLLDADPVATVLTRFTGEIRAGLGLGAPRGVIAVDGKSLRGGYARGRASMPPLMVSVWDAETRISIAACRAPGGNEVAATLALLKTLTLKGRIVTADALHCHPAMAEAVLATGADYALGLKGNHGPLYQAAIVAFEDIDALARWPFHETTETAHDRQEWRCASVIACPRNAPAFPSLTAIGRIQAERRRGDRIESATRYIALSTLLTPVDGGVKCPQRTFENSPLLLIGPCPGRAPDKGQSKILGMLLLTGGGCCDEEAWRSDDDPGFAPPLCPFRGKLQCR